MARMNGMIQAMGSRPAMMLAALALWVCLGHVQEALAGRLLSAAELKRLHGTYHAIWKGKHARVRVNRDGTLIARSGTRVDVGRWRVKGNRLCVAFRVWTRGKYRCGTVERQGSWYVGLRRKNGEPRLKLRR